MLFAIECYKINIGHPSVDYDGEEEEDYEEGEETEAEEETPATPKSNAKDTQGREENSVLEQEEPKPNPSVEREDEEDEDEDNEVEKSEVRPETTTTEAPPVIDLCQLSNGGCDHNCRFSRENSRVECSCFSGFALDSGDGRTCHGESQFHGLGFIKKEDRTRINHLNFC